MVDAVRFRLMLLEMPQVRMRLAIEKISSIGAPDSIPRAMLQSRARVVAMACRLFNSTLGWTGGAVVVLFALAIHATPARAQVYEYDAGSGCYKEESGAVASCTGYPGPASSPSQGPQIGYDPCFLAQNAMRPCTSDQGKAPEPVGVDANLVGTWEIPFKRGPWVLTINRDGTYKFHSEAQDGTPSHGGIFSASNGRWSLKAATGYADSGFYLFQAPDLWIATGKVGAAAWLRPALAQKEMHSCTSDLRPISKRSGVDANLIGTWELSFKGGPWVLTIGRDGTYKFHSEARDGAPSHSGTFSAGKGHWSLKSSNGYTDAGYYLFQAPGVWIATGKLGSAAWLRPASDSASCKPNP